MSFLKFQFDSVVIGSMEGGSVDTVVEECVCTLVGTWVGALVGARECVSNEVIT